MAVQDVKERHPLRSVHANARHARRTVVQNSARICIPADVCAACARVQTWLVACNDARIAACSVCVHPVDRLKRVIGTRVESRSAGARALRYATGQPAAMRPRNRVERSALLTIAITRE